jgi:hypothetical protein
MLRAPPGSPAAAAQRFEFIQARASAVDEEEIDA